MTKPFAFVFPGQGSQSVGMLDAWGGHPAVAATLLEASEAAREDVGKLIREGPEADLALTVNTQLVMLVAGVANYRAWRAEGGPVPAMVAGHSLGEYSALVAAGAIALRDAVPLVRFRAQAMQQAVPVGSGSMMAILGLDGREVAQACEQAARDSGQTVAAANFNDPKQTVIAGTVAGVDAAVALLKARGAKRAMPLAVSAPFHCALMRPAAEQLRQRLAATPIATPAVPVINNIDVAAPTEPDAIRDALYRQAFGPVRWVEIIEAMHAQGMRHILECGPGRVLAKMIKRIEHAQVESATVLDPASLAEAREMLA
ncbi:MAG: ACP S-malonyltransferase [Burkholderiales bacterium]|nr:ACP S-malonyltransferase [Burkholderiales bacterium]